MVTFSAIYELKRDGPVVNGTRNLSTQGKPLPKPKSMATFQDAVVRDGEHSMANCF